MLLELGPQGGGGPQGKAETAGSKWQVCKGATGSSAQVAINQSGELAPTIGKEEPISYHGATLQRVQSWRVI